MYPHRHDTANSDTRPALLVGVVKGCHVSPFSVLVDVQDELDLRIHPGIRMPVPGTGYVE